MGRNALRSLGKCRGILQWLESGAFMPCVLWQLSVRGKNSKEKLSGFFRTVTQSVDEVLLSNQKDKDEFFDHQRTFLVEYFTRVKDATMKSDKMTKSHKSKSVTSLCVKVFVFI